MENLVKNINTQIEYYHQQIKEYAPNMTNTMLFVARIEALNWVLEQLEDTDG